MKYLNAFIAIIIVCLLLGCGANDSIGKNEEKDNVTAKENPVKIMLESVICDARQAKTENNYSVFADFKNENISLFDASADKELASIAVSYGIGSLYFSMMDENNGCLLYCSSPACGLMMKQLYVTKDRWQTYDEMDISSQIDGYPTSLSVHSDKHLYIGAQMRSDGYLFETTDGGTSWNPVIIDDEIEKCQYGYAPIIDSKNDIYYLLLECYGSYSLYQSDTMLSDWKLLGTFPLDGESTPLKSYFILKDAMIIEDIQGQTFRLSMPCIPSHGQELRCTLNFRFLRCQDTLHWQPHHKVSFWNNPVFPVRQWKIPHSVFVQPVYKSANQPAPVSFRCFLPAFLYSTLP